MQAKGMLPPIMALKEPCRVLYGLWRALGCYYPPPQMDNQVETKLESDMATGVINWLHTDPSNT